MAKSLATNDEMLSRLRALRTATQPDTQPVHNHSDSAPDVPSPTGPSRPVWRAQRPSVHTSEVLTELQVGDLQAWTAHVGKGRWGNKRRGQTRPNPNSTKTTPRLPTVVNEQQIAPPPPPPPPPPPAAPEEFSDAGVGAPLDAGVGGLSPSSRRFRRTSRTVTRLNNSLDQVGDQFKEWFNLVTVSTIELTAW